MDEQQPEQPNPQPGWYPDQQGVMRWWDGQAWTDQVAPPPAYGQQPAYGQAPPRSGVHVGKLIGGIALLLLVLVSLGNAASQDFANAAEAFGYLLVPGACLIGGILLIVFAFRKR